ncbi:MAG: cysteine desulfurase family protein [Candidatus Saccharibacteria bacterium]|nr:cysteine desulfurase family protein [Candidatus Saccharibacteria bacterium]
MIYLDHAAATPMTDKAREAMMPYLSELFFNPSAAYLPAKKVKSDYEAAKASISRAIGAKASDLVITAGATEANNLAFGVLEYIDSRSCCCACTDSVHTFSPRADSRSFSQADNPETEAEAEAERRGRPSIQTQATKPTSSSSLREILYLETEHDSVREVAKKYGGKSIKVLQNGLIDLADLERKINDNTVLVSVALVNNEIGTIQPLAEIASIFKRIKFNRLKRGIKTPLLLHSDASQALNLLDINVARLGVDLMTLNAAKVYGPKGIGALYISRGVKLPPLVSGGGQERGLRAGTENVASTVSFAAAITEAKEHIQSNRKKYAKWREILLSELEDYELINKKYTLDNFVVLCYNGLDAERLIYLLEDYGVYVSTGAACAASKGKKSHVLKAIGLSDSEINGSLRLTFGETNTTGQIVEVAKILNSVTKAERKRIKNEQ